MLAPGVQQSDSVIYKYICILFQVLFDDRLLQDEFSFSCKKNGDIITSYTGLFCQLYETMFIKCLTNGGYYYH